MQQPDLFDAPRPNNAEHLKRVSARIGAAIIEFCRANTGDVFHADDLRRHVIRRCGTVAPGSADRVMRDLRKRRVIDYTLLSRHDSLYRCDGTSP